MHLFFVWSFPGLYEMCDCVCHLLHHLHNGRVQICGRILQSCRGTVKVLLQYQHIILVLRLKVTFYFYLYRCLASSPPLCSLWIFTSFLTSWPLSLKQEGSPTMSRPESQVTTVITRTNLVIRLQQCFNPGCGYFNLET